jgi:hypothetical protein
LKLAYYNTLSLSKNSYYLQCYLLEKHTYHGKIVQASVLYPYLFGLRLHFFQYLIAAKLLCIWQASVSYCPSFLPILFKLFVNHLFYL